MTFRDLSSEGESVSSKGVMESSRSKEKSAPDVMKHGKSTFAQGSKTRGTHKHSHSNARSKQKSGVTPIEKRTVSMPPRPFEPIEPRVHISEEEKKRLERIARKWFKDQPPIFDL